MNQDRPMTPAQSCSREIWDLVTRVDNSGEEITAPMIEGIIQRLLSSEVASVHGEYQKLAKEWSMEAESRYEHARRDLLSCTAAVEALAPNKESQP